jgi:hypothetical protein
MGDLGHNKGVNDGVNGVFLGHGLFLGHYKGVYGGVKWDTFKP